MANFTIKRTVHTGIAVADIERSKAFYRDVLDFPVTDTIHHTGKMVGDLMGVDGAEVDIAFVSLPGHEIELLQFSVPSGVKTSDLRPVDVGCKHIAFEVDDVNAVLQAIQAGGFEPVAPPQTPAAGPRKGGKIVYTRDPDGTFLEFMQMPGG
jgi:glyoxylase I family protein